MVEPNRWWQQGDNYPPEPEPEEPQAPSGWSLSNIWGGPERTPEWMRPYLGAGQGRISFLPQLPGRLGQWLAPRWERVPQPLAEAWRMGLAAPQQFAYGLERGIGTAGLLAERELMKQPAYARRYGEMSDERIRVFEDTTTRDIWEASRLTYSMAFDPERTMRILDALDEGVDPDEALAGQGSTWKELIGQVVLDPLNYVGNTKMLKTGDLAEAITTYRKASGAVKGVAEFAGEAARFLKPLPEMAPEALGLAKELPEEAGRVQRLVGGLLHPVPETRAARLVDSASTMVQTFGKQVRDPDELIGAMRALTSDAAPAHEIVGDNVRLSEVGQQLRYIVGKGPGDIINLPSAKLWAEKGMAAFPRGKEGFVVALAHDFENLVSDYAKTTFGVSGGLSQTRAFRAARTAAGIAFLENPAFVVRNAITGWVIAAFQGIDPFAMFRPRKEFLEQMGVKPPWIGGGWGGPERPQLLFGKMAGKVEGYQQNTIFASVLSDAFFGLAKWVDQGGVYTRPDELLALCYGISREFGQSVEAALLAGLNPDHTMELLKQVFKGNRLIAPTDMDEILKGASPATRTQHAQAVQEAVAKGDVQAVEKIAADAEEHAGKIARAAESVEGPALSQEQARRRIGEIAKQYEGRVLPEGVQVEMDDLQRILSGAEEVPISPGALSDAEVARLEAEGLKGIRLAEEDFRTLVKARQVEVDGAVKALDPIRRRITEADPNLALQINDLDARMAEDLEDLRVPHRAAREEFRLQTQQRSDDIKARMPSTPEREALIGPLWKEYHAQQARRELAYHDKVMERIARMRDDLEGLLGGAEEAPRPKPPAPKPTPKGVLPEAAVPPAEAPARVAERSLTRSWRAGMNQGTITFASAEQQELYDLGAANRLGALDIENVSEPVRQARIARLEEAKTQPGRLNQARQVYQDVRTQMAGLQDNEVRQVVDNVGLARAAEAAPGVARGAAPVGRIGAETIARGPDPKMQYDLRFRVMELSEPIASNLPDMSPNPAYIGELQPRLRERPVSQLQVQNMVAEPVVAEFLEDTHTLDRGPIIIGPDLMVESGNGRKIALERLATERPELYAQYKQALIDRAADYGLDPQEIAQMQQPILVRERLTEVADRLKFVEDANERGTLGLSMVEQALSDARALSANIISELGINSAQPWETALLSAGNRDFVRRFIEAIPENERPALVDAEGALSLDGLRRIGRALFARAYGKERTQLLLADFFEAADPDMRNLGNALLDAAPPMARVQALVEQGLRKPEYAIGRDMVDAAEAALEIHRSKIPLTQWRQQIPGLRKETSAAVEIMTDFLAVSYRSRVRIADFLAAYANEVEKLPDIRQIAMMEAAPATVVELLGRAAGAVLSEAERQAIAADVGIRMGPGAATGWPPNFMDATSTQAGVIRRLVERAKQAIGGKREPVEIPSDLYRNLEQYVRGLLAREQLEAKLAASGVAEARTKQAILNYTDRDSYDRMLSTVFPWQYWYTRTGRYALERIKERPAYLLHLYRLEQAFNEAEAEPGFPTRLRRKVKLSVPWLPDWMGDSVYFEPLAVLPFPPFTEPYLPEATEDTTKFGEWYRKLTAFISPWPFLTWALAQGGALGPKEEWITGPQIPLLRQLRGLAQATGAVSPEAGVFGPEMRAMGLPVQERWDVYRTEAMLGYLASEKMIDDDAAKEAMISHKGAAWEMAKERMNKMQGLRTLLGMVLPRADFLPEGERMVRDLKVIRDQALDQTIPGYSAMTYEEQVALRKARPDLDRLIKDTYSKFYDEHPEYGVRAMLFTEPDERVRGYAINKIWEKYMEMGPLAKKAARLYLGEEYEKYFVNKDTRDYNRFKTEDLVELAALLGIPISTLEVGMTSAELQRMPITPPEERAVAPVAPTVRAAPTPASNLAKLSEKEQVMLSEVEKQTGLTIKEIYALQDEYFELPQGGQERRDFLVQHPELKTYWDTRRALVEGDPSFEGLTDTMTSAGERKEATAIRGAVGRTPTGWGLPQLARGPVHWGGGGGAGGAGGRRRVSWTQFKGMVPAWVWQELRAHFMDGTPITARLRGYIVENAIPMLSLGARAGDWRGWLQSFGWEVFSSEAA